MPHDPASPALPSLPSAAERDFSGYNAAQAGRGVRPLVRRAAALAGDPAGRTALELGCGRGIEAAHCAELGWRVETYDVDPSVEGELAALSAHLPITHRTADLGDLTDLPPHHLLIASATLPFLDPDGFSRLWRIIRRRLQPGGVLAADFFGTRDDWARSGSEGTFHTREQVLALLEGMEIVELEESERDGRSYAGPKHWHTIAVLARA